MKIRHFATIGVLAGSLALTACSQGASAPMDSPAASQAAAPVLTGSWQQANSQSADAYQTANVTADSIEIYWVSNGGDTESLYWAGSFVPPSKPGPYTWDSANDKSKTSSAMLASGDPTKTFTYTEGVISYKVSALGTTSRVELKRK